MKEFLVEEFIDKRIPGAGHSRTEIKRTPMGEKVIIHAAKPGLVVGRKGQNIRDLTDQLKRQFEMENPQVEISEVEHVYLDPNIVAERVANALERYGPMRFKNIAHNMLENVIDAGALGIEILISGKIPGARAKSWRFFQGYLKKSGSVNQNDIKHAKKTALLKTGIVGIQVKIMTADVVLPDHIIIFDEEDKKKTQVEELRKVAKATPGANIDAAEDKPVKIEEPVADQEIIVEETASPVESTKDEKP